MHGIVQGFCVSGGNSSIGFLCELCVVSDTYLCLIFLSFWGAGVIISCSLLLQASLVNFWYDIFSLQYWSKDGGRFRNVAIMREAERCGVRASRLNCSKTKIPHPLTICPMLSALRTAKGGECPFFDLLETAKTPNAFHIACSLSLLHYSRAPCICLPTHIHTYIMYLLSGCLDNEHERCFKLFYCRDSEVAEGKRVRDAASHVPRGR